MALEIPPKVSPRKFKMSKLKYYVKAFVVETADLYDTVFLYVSCPG